MRACNADTMGRDSPWGTDHFKTMRSGVDAMIFLENTFARCLSIRFVALVYMQTECHKKSVHR
jgi:hypothetical protein